jgi:hypothetical protein
MLAILQSRHAGLDPASIVFLDSGLRGMSNLRYLIAGLISILLSRLIDLISSLF